MRNSAWTSVTVCNGRRNIRLRDDCPPPPISFLFLLPALLACFSSPQRHTRTLDQYQQTAQFHRLLTAPSLSGPRTHTRLCCPPCLLVERSLQAASASTRPRKTRSRCRPTRSPSRSPCSAQARRSAGRAASFSTGAGPSSATPESTLAPTGCPVCPSSTRLTGARLTSFSSRSTQQSPFSKRTLLLSGQR